jgi:nucleoside-diphosphate-sugar epimerase
MMLEGRSILVTGGTGFLGSRLIEKLILEQRACVRVLVRNFAHAARIARFPVEMVGGDITDETVVQKAVQGCDVVFHCAYDFTGTREHQKQVGIQGARNVCEAALRAGVSRLVHVSTFSVYAPMSDGDLTESSPWPRSTSAYVLVKREAERLLLDRHKRQGLPVVVLQPTLVYGPFSLHWTINTVNNLRTGLVPLVNEGEGSCNAVYIDDVINAMILAATQPDGVGETFLISGEQPVTWKTFYGAFEAVLGIRATVDMPERELNEELKKRIHRSRTIPRLLYLARRPEFISLLAQLPVVRDSLKILRNRLSDGQWEDLKSRFYQSNSGDRRQNGRPDRPIYVPDKMLLALYQSKTRVCIDKAKRQLGYVPQFDFDQGMDMTARFIRWANLL